MVVMLMVLLALMDMLPVHLMPLPPLLADERVMVMLPPLMLMLVSLLMAVQYDGS